MTTPSSPLSQSRNVALEATYATAEIAGDYATVYGVDVRKHFDGLAEICRWRCLDSDLSFFTPNTCAGGSDFYRGLSRHDWYYMTEKWEYAAALRLLPRVGSVLEVGCGHGHFLDQCVRKGLRAVGLELSPPQSGRSCSEQIEILDEMIAAHAENHPQEYDAVCSFQVLEHVPDPKQFLEACCHALKLGGKLILCTPNADSFLRLARSLLDMPPHHITGWREQTYRYLENILPLRLEKILYEPLADYHVDFFIRTYRKKYTQLLDPRALWAKEPLASLARKALQLGGRKLLKGQSILAVFERT
jgi:SAM-dependent methyltransferase